jgi:hypothetical protein
VTIIVVDPAREIATYDAASGGGGSGDGFASRPTRATAQEHTKNNPSQQFSLVHSFSSVSTFTKHNFNHSLDIETM